MKPRSYLCCPYRRHPLCSPSCLRSDEGAWIRGHSCSVLRRRRRGAGRGGCAEGKSKRGGGSFFSREGSSAGSPALPGLPRASATRRGGRRPGDAEGVPVGEGSRDRRRGARRPDGAPPSRHSVLGAVNDGVAGRGWAKAAWDRARR